MEREIVRGNTIDELNEKSTQKIREGWMLEEGIGLDHLGYFRIIKRAS